MFAEICAFKIGFFLFVNKKNVIHWDFANEIY